MVRARSGLRIGPTDSHKLLPEVGEQVRLARLPRVAIPTWPRAASEHVVHQILFGLLLYLLQDPVTNAQFGLTVFRVRQLQDVAWPILAAPLQTIRQLSTRH